MKTVFTNSMCAHTWAQQSQPHGRSNSMRFDGDTLYSYRTAIARIVGGMDIALVTSEKYSITTSCKHMPWVHRALPQSMEQFTVPIVTARSVSEHKKNLDYLIAEYGKVRDSIRRARDCEHDNYRYDWLADKADRVTQYGLRFELDYTPCDAKADAAELRKFRRERDARLNTPAMAAKREHARNMRETYRANAAARKAEKIEKERAEAITKFRNQERDSMYIHGLGYALCRISRDGRMVETSQGAHVEVQDARRALTLIGSLMRAGGWESTSDGAGRIAVGQFELRQVTADGRVTIGCHRFECAELAALASLLHMPEATMSATL